MPVSPRSVEEKLTDDCIQQKSAYLKDIRLLFEQERMAIESLDIEKLSSIIYKLDAVLSEMESLDNQESDGKHKRISERERALIIDSLKELSNVGDENLRYLLDKREETLAQLKGMHVKKAANKAYGRSQAMKKAGL